MAASGKIQLDRADAIPIHPGERGWRCRDCIHHKTSECIYPPPQAIAGFEAACWDFKRGGKSSEVVDNLGTLSVKLDSDKKDGG